MPCHHHLVRTLHPRAPVGSHAPCLAPHNFAPTARGGRWECGVCLSRNSLHKVPNRSRYEFGRSDPPPELADECIVATLSAPPPVAPATLLVLDLRQEAEGFRVAQRALLRALDSVPEPAPVGATPPYDHQR